VGLVWSPDSRWIAFSRRFDRGASVWRVEVETGRVKQVTRAAR
jgi:Tol biopolymer transport system component